MIHSVFLCSFLTLFLIIGCATSVEQCDPDKEGFINSTVGVLSGCYDERVKLEHQRVQDEKQKNEQLAEKNRQLRSESERKKQQLGAVQRRMQEIESQIPVLQKRIADREVSEQMNLEITRLRLELERLEELESSLSDSI